MPGTSASSARVRGGDSTLLREDVVDLPELHASHRCLVAGHAEVVAGLLVEEARFPEREVAQRPQPLGELVVVGEHHPALAGGDDLVRVEAEAGDARRTTPVCRPANGCAVRLGAVLDHGEVVALGDLGRGVHVDRVAEQVDRDDRLASAAVISASTRSRSRFHVSCARSRRGPRPRRCGTRRARSRCSSTRSTSTSSPGSDVQRLRSRAGARSSRS